MITLIFAGDIDGDGILDLIIDTFIPPMFSPRIF
jgi:hypothetical protein